MNEAEIQTAIVDILSERLVNIATNANDLHDLLIIFSDKTKNGDLYKIANEIFDYGLSIIDTYY